MKAIINRKEFSAATKRAASIAPAESPLEVLKGVLLEADAGKITLTATNMELCLEQKLPCDLKEPGAFVIDTRLLAAMLEKLAGDTVEVEWAPGTHQAVIRSGDAHYIAPVWEKKSFPKMEIPFPEDTVKVGGISDMARRTVFATAQDGKEPLLKCVNLMFTKDGLRAAGSDGSCFVSAIGDKKSTGNTNLLLPAASLDKLARMCGSGAELQVGTTGKTVVFLKENFAFSARLVDGDYINADQLIAAIANTFTVLTDVAELRKAMNVATCVDSGGKVTLSFQDRALTFNCTGDCGSSSTTMEVIPLTGTPTGKYAFLAGRLSESLQALSGTVTLGIAQNGMLTLSTEDAFYMQTGLRASAAKAKPKKAA